MFSGEFRTEVGRRLAGAFTARHQFPPMLSAHSELDATNSAHSELDAANSTTNSARTDWVVVRVDRRESWPVPTKAAANGPLSS